MDHEFDIHLEVEKKMIHTYSRVPDKLICGASEAVQGRGFVPPA